MWTISFRLQNIKARPFFTRQIFRVQWKPHNVINLSRNKSHIDSIKWLIRLSSDFIERIPPLLIVPIKEMYIQMIPQFYLCKCFIETSLNIAPVLGSLFSDVRLRSRCGLVSYDGVDMVIVGAEWSLTVAGTKVDFDFRMEEFLKTNKMNILWDNLTKQQFRNINTV